MRRCDEQWLRTNGDAIFGSRPWHTPEGATADGLPVRFTVTEGALNAIVLGTPTGRTVVLPDVDASTVTAVDLLGHHAPLTWRAAPNGIEIDLPSRPPTGPAIALRLHTQ